MGSSKGGSDLYSTEWALVLGAGVSSFVVLNLS